MDERHLPTTNLGRGTKDTRSRLSVILKGSCRVWLGDRADEVTAGNAVIVSPLSRLAIGSDRSDCLELDWRATGGPIAYVLRLPTSVLLSAQKVADCVRDTGVSRFSLAHATVDLLAGLRALGLEVPDGSVLDETDPFAGEAQAVMNVLDHALSNLGGSPNTQDLEATLGCSRWTLTRLLNRVHAAYDLCGVGGGTDWRSLRDHWRLRAASSLVTHPRANTRSIARTVGYGSPEAMCHAFANVGLPSPGRMRRAVMDAW